MRKADSPDATIVAPGTSTGEANGEQPAMMRRKVLHEAEAQSSIGW
jgi:hypothetical protein